MRVVLVDKQRLRRQLLRECIATNPNIDVVAEHSEYDDAVRDAQVLAEANVVVASTDDPLLTRRLRAFLEQRADTALVVVGWETGVPYAATVLGDVSPAGLAELVHNAGLAT